MTYYNIISNFGVTKFCKKASEVGVSGLIVPDMPIEENDTEKFYEEAQKNDLINIRLLSPISTVDRIKKNIDIAEGMIYFVSRQGTTGAKKEMDKKLSANVNMLKKFTRLPVGVGFGISSPEHIETLKKTDADVAVIGSAVIKAYKKSGLSGVKTFLSNIIKSL
jgi:tryptophan synthase alpha subunit